jgi:hypothetical protein
MEVRIQPLSASALDVSGHRHAPTTLMPVSFIQGAPEPVWGW